MKDVLRQAAVADKRQDSRQTTGAMRAVAPLVMTWKRLLGQLAVARLGLGKRLGTGLLGQPAVADSNCRGARKDETVRSVRLWKIASCALLVDRLVD